MCERSNLQCTCGHKSESIEEMAIHNYFRHLQINVSCLMSCPFCSKELPDLDDGVKHCFEHLTEDQLEVSKLISWMSKQKYRPPKIRTSESTTSRTFRNFQIVLPTIAIHHRCLYCSKFVYSNGNNSKSILEHVLSHFPQFSSQVMEIAAIWFKEFFTQDDSKPIVTKHCDFLSVTKNLDLESSKLLQELGDFETENTTVCRYCNVNLGTTKKLYSHCAETHHKQSVKYFNCYICNFKESDGNNYFAHIIRRHMKCHCGNGNNFQSFHKCLLHAHRCSRFCCRCREKVDRKSHSPCPLGEDIGVRCPACKRFPFNDELVFRQHVLTDCKPWL